MHFYSQKWSFSHLMGNPHSDVILFPTVSDRPIHGGPLDGCPGSGVGWGTATLGVKRPLFDQKTAILGQKTTFWCQKTAIFRSKRPLFGVRNSYFLGQKRPLFGVKNSYFLRSKTALLRPKRPLKYCILVLFWR